MAIHTTVTTNNPVYLTADHLDLIESLDMARKQANSIEAQASQSGTYGLIVQALEYALTTAIFHSESSSFDGIESGLIAKALYQALLDGMSVLEAVEAWNADNITVEA